MEIAGYNAGLFNMGSIYHINYTVQCLHSVPELKSILIKYPHCGRSKGLDQSSRVLACASRDLFSEHDKNVKPVAPM